MKIAIIGKMGSGKSTCAKYLEDKYNFKIHSFGGPVKKYAKEIFNQKDKNRELIQTFAQKIKEIDNDVWVKYLINNINHADNIVVDDLRFPNEHSVLKKEGFTIIKLTISEKFQEKRIKQTYPDNYLSHLNRRYDVSESFTDSLNADYHFNISESSENNYEEFLDNIIKNLRTC